MQDNIGKQIEDAYKQRFQLPNERCTMVSSPSPALPFDCLQIMNLSLQIDSKVTGDEGVCWLYLKQAIQRKEPARTIVNTVRDMAQDNFYAVADVLGNGLTNKILSHDNIQNTQTFQR